MRVAIALVIVAIGMVAAISPSFASETITYTYDALGRLVKVVHTGTVNNNQQTVYSIDPADNRTNVTTTGAPH
jgi:YD repeat-containing protein